MITAINADNATLYRNLFSEAEDKLKGYESVTVYNTDIAEYFVKNGNEFVSLNLSAEADPFTKFFETLNGDAENQIPGQKVYIKNGLEPKNASITSLEEYFHWLPELLIKLDENGKEVRVPTKFAILPLDEPHFIINANTRAINIPAEFKKNGVAVQGDDLAEIVYFEIDRFFDTMDLNNCNILIQWETPKGDKGVIKGVSREYVRDIESKPGKLIFGWALDKDITRASGNLKLSVKFYETDEVEIDGKTTTAIVYSFNTLTATVSIHQSIGLNLSDKDSYIVSEDATANLLERLEPSVVVGKLDAADPIFLDFPYGEVDEDGYDIDYDTDDKTGILKIYSLAFAPDTGMISYDWRKTELSLDNEATGMVRTVKYNSELEYVPVTLDELKADSTHAKDRLIFIKIDEQFKPVGTGENVIGSGDRYVGVALYEKKAVYAVSGPGIYSVRAKNRQGNSLASVMSTDFGADKAVVVKRPEDVIMDNKDQTADKHFIGEETGTLAPKFNAKEPGVCTYQWFKASLDADGKPVVADKLSSSNSSITGMEKIDGKVSYGKDEIRLCIPNTIGSAQKPNTDLGAKPERYYVTFKSNAPEGAVYFLETQTTISTGEVVRDKAMKRLDEQHESLKDRKTVRTCYFSIAERDPSTGIMTSFVKDGRADGRIENLEWYDENQNLIGIDEVVVKYFNFDNYIPCFKYEMVVDATDKSLEAKEEGIFRLEITRHRNNDTKVGHSIDYRVTQLPQVPIVINEGDKQLDLSKVIKGDLKLQIQLADYIIADSFNIIIMRDHNNHEGDFKVRTINATPNSESIIEIDPNTFLTEINKHNAQFGDELELNGRYYAVLQSVLNGGVSESVSTEDSLVWIIVED